MTKEIKQVVTFQAKPGDVFEALMDETKHSLFTGEMAKIERRVGGGFTCYGDYINGITLELDPDRLIVQAWRSQNWPKETFSIITIKLASMAGGKTKLSFSQIGVPAADCGRKEKGWRSHYWGPLQRFLQSAGAPPVQKPASSRKRSPDGRSTGPR